MTTIILISSIIILAAAVASLVSYYQGREILRPAKRKSALTLFPDQLALPFEDIAFRTADGIMLRGWYIPNDASDTTIICMHGWTSNRSSALAHTNFLHAQGFNLMYFDFRGHGESGGDISTIGHLERRDVEAALEFLKFNKEEHCAKIGFYGVSMGAAVAITEAAAHPEIRCVVAESSFDSYEYVAGRWAWVNKKIPYYPFVPPALFWVRMQLGADPELDSPLYHVAKISPRPLLFINGSHDNIVPPASAKRLFDAAKEPKEQFIVPGAGHAKCAEVGGQSYRDKMTEFFKKNLS